jgi:hypothetical protein
LHVQKALMEYLLCGRLDWFFEVICLY